MEPSDRVREKWRAHARLEDYERYPLQAVPEYTPPHSYTAGVVVESVSNMMERLRKDIGIGDSQHH